MVLFRSAGAYNNLLCSLFCEIRFLGFCRGVCRICQWVIVKVVTVMYI